MNAFDVSIIIVSYNTKAKTLRCIESIYRHTRGISFEVIVAENGSSDGSMQAIKEAYPSVVLIDNGHNLGFGKANNIALKKASGKYIFYLNSDAYINNNAVKLFYDFWEKSASGDNIGALGAFLRSPSGQYIHAGSSFPGYRDFCREQFRSNLIYFLKTVIHLTHLEKAYKKAGDARKRKQDAAFSEIEEMDIDYITGADLFLKNNKDAFFNENYFMYCEETELELNMGKKGLRRILIKGPMVVHDQEEGKAFKIYRTTDCFRERSEIEYSIRNLQTKAVLLQILYLLGNLNPYIRKVRKEAEKIYYRREVDIY